MLAEQFEQVALLLRTWTPTPSGTRQTTERKLLVNEIIRAVIVHPDHLQVALNGGPPLTIAFSEVVSGKRNGRP